MRPQKRARDRRPRAAIDHHTHVTLHPSCGDVHFVHDEEVMGLSYERVRVGGCGVVLSRGIQGDETGRPVLEDGLR